MKKINKGEPGYLNYKKVFLLTTVLIFVVIVAVFFFTGYIRYKSTKTIFTVLAVLMVLPAAKQFVIYAVIAPYKSVGIEIYNRIYELAKENEVCIVSDMVITNQERVSNIDIICIKGGRILGYFSNKKTDNNFITEYLKDIISPNYKVNQVKMYDDVDKYEKAIKDLLTIESNKYDKAIAGFILTQSV